MCYLQTNYQNLFLFCSSKKIIEKQNQLFCHNFGAIYIYLLFVLCMLFMPSKTLKALKRNEKCGERVFFFYFSKKANFYYRIYWQINRNNYSNTKRLQFLLVSRLYCMARLSLLFHKCISMKKTKTHKESKDHK